MSFSTGEGASLVGGLFGDPVEGPVAGPVGGQVGGPIGGHGAPELAASARPRLAQRMKLLERTVRQTPIVTLDEPGLNLFAKLEFQSLVGSIKDRPALWILKAAIERREIDEETVIVESSSGNFALALAAYARLLGLRFVPVIDPNVAPLNESMLRSLCDRVIKVEERDDTGGYLKTRLATVKGLVDADPHVFWPNQYANRDGMLGHYHLTAGEICQAFERLDFVFVAVSSAGTISGVSRRLREAFPDVKIIAVDAEGSVIFGGPPKKRFIPGVGASVVPGLLRDALVDDVVSVPEVDTVAACRELFARHKLFAGGSSGTAYAAIQRYAPKMRGMRTPNVLFLCADRGTAYLDTVYDDRWAAWRREAQ